MHKIPQVRPEERPDAKTAWGALMCVLILVAFGFASYAFVHHVAMPLLHMAIERVMEARILF